MTTPEPFANPVQEAERVHHANVAAIQERHLSHYLAAWNQKFQEVMRRRNDPDVAGYEVFAAMEYERREIAGDLADDLLREEEDFRHAIGD